MGRFLRNVCGVELSCDVAVRNDGMPRQLFCKIGTDVYLMRDVWNLCKDFIKYTMDTWFIPGKVAVKKGKK